MPRRLWVCAGICLFVVEASATPVQSLLHQRVSMRDGVRLDTNVFHPAGVGRFPTILIRTPYGKGPDLVPAYNAFIDRGYAIVIQDVRGRYGSEGTFDPLEQEGPDGYDTLNWVARQPWSDGNIGMMGGSYIGIAQWKVAVLGNPHLKAIFPVVSGYDDYLDRFYSTGGATKLGHRLGWLSENMALPGLQRPHFGDYINHLPLRTADQAATGHTLDVYQKILNHPTYDAFWKSLSVKEKLDRMHVPVFAIGGWYDNYAQSDLEAFAALDRIPGHPEHHVLIGPWPHNMSIKFSSEDFGTDSSAPIRTYQLAWFDHWLKGRPESLPQASPESWHQANSAVDAAPVHIFVMGVNHWRDEREWPPSRVKYTPMYLKGKGQANTAEGDGELDWRSHHSDQPDHFTYDPRHPAPTLGGSVCCNPKDFPWGPFDQRAVETRQDVLVYTSSALKHNLEVTGPVKVVLYVSTDAPDTDFTAKLIDVFPNGSAVNLTDGLLRMRYRNGIDKVAPPVQSAETYALTIDAGVTSNVFLPGHRIRVEISSSNFPRFDRNPNTGRPVADEVSLRKAEQIVYHGHQFPSHVLLPIVPELTSTSATRYGTKRSLTLTAR
ncbi:MAG TPA: CocE/NonD family hydrolase [Bryobacteraceae bacterium]|nr:CocE/NonD family hydrolase [Bryobacteraceae bacterium]